RGGPVGELTPEDDDAGAPPWIVGTPLVRRDLARRDPFEPETLEELPRPLIHSAGEDVVEALALRFRHEVGDQPLAYPFSLEARDGRSEEHTSELQSRENLVCRLLLEKKKEQP